MRAPKHILSLLVAVASSIATFAAPAFSAWQECHLKDGTPVTLRLIGDELYHYWESETGYIALEQADGTFVLTDETVPSSEEVTRLRNAARPEPQPMRAIGVPTKPARGVVLLVQFADVKFGALNDKNAFSDMFNKPGYNYEGASGSAADYFKAQSDTAYQPVFDVFGPITLEHDIVYYGEQVGTVNDQYIADFVIDAVTAADAAGCNFSQYDGDNDGNVDIVYLIYAGKGQADGGATSTIWPHNWKVSSALSAGRKHSSWTSITWLLKWFDGKRIDNYACSAELDGKTAKRAGIGTFCHEFSHVLGLPDYYPTKTTAKNKGKNFTPGAWSVMDQGLYNNAGKTPPNYSAFDKYFMGWLTPKALPKDKQSDVTLTTEYNDVYQISGTTSVIPKAYKTAQRMWYLENRQKTGWDAYLPGHGLCIWEIAYNNSNWTDNVPNNDTVGCTIVTAGNQTRPYLPYKDKAGLTSTSATPFPGTTGKKTFTAAEGCAISDIAEKTGIITFKYNGGTPLPTEYPYELLGEHCTLPVDGIADANAPLELIITPDEGYTLAEETCWTVEMGGTELTYNIHFTYDPLTNMFRIPAVTGDVVVLVEAVVYVPTDLNPLNFTEETTATKLVFQNGILFIQKKGKLYDLMARPIVSD